jgi:hypothetical protein
MEIFNKKIKENFDYEFEIEESGLYAIEIIASCKSWRQNLIKFTSFFKDDDLSVKIDNIEFPKLNGKKGLFDGEAAWNGNNLKGLKKINIFLIKLEKGNHSVYFLINQEPHLESVNIFKLQDLKNISYTPKSNNPPEDGNRRQWLNFVIVNLPLKNLSITASAEKREGDDDDLKLIIGGEIQKNIEPKSHKYWYWCGRILKGKQKEFHKEVNLPQGLHYIELWADRMPTLDKIIFDIMNINNSLLLQKYTYRGVGGDEDYNRFDKEIIESVDEWNNKFLEQDYPPTEPLDPNLVKAMIYIESRMGYEKGGYPDVMQVGDLDNPALHSLRKVAGYLANEFISKNQNGHLSYNFPKERLPVKIESSEESIFWGARWLYYKAQKYYGTGENNLNPPFIREWKIWEQAIIDYNGSSRKYEYQKKVWNIYKDGIDPNNNILWRETPGGFSLIKTLGLVSLFLIVFLAGVFYGTNFRVFNNKNTNVPYYYGYTNQTDEPVKKIFLKNLEEYKKDKNYYGDVFQETVNICEKVRCCMECVVGGYYNDLVNHMKSNEQLLKAMQVFDFMKNTQTGERNIQTGDIDNDGENEIVFIRRDVLNNDYIIITVIDKIEDKFKLIEKKMDEGYDGYIKLLDVTSDLQPEVLLFMSQGRGGYPLSIYKYLENKKLQKIFESGFSLFPEYTFSDLDLDGKMEIKMEGELKNASSDYRAFVERIYKYNEEKNGFELVSPL